MEYGTYIEMVQMQVYDLASLVFNSDVVDDWDKVLSDPSSTEGDKMLSNLELGDYLTKTTNSYSSVSSVTVYRDNNLWINGEYLIGKNDFFTREIWYRNFKDQSFYWSSAHVDAVEVMKNNNHAVIGMAMPLDTFQPKFAKNVLKVNVNESYFLEPLNRIHLGQDGTIFLLDRYGQPLLTQSEFPDDHELADHVQNIIANGQTQGTIYLDSKGSAKEILVYKKLPKTKWVLIGIVSENDLYAELFSLRKSIILIASFLLALSVIVAIVLSHSISKPLTSLVAAMRHVQRGEFNQAELRIQPESVIRTEMGFVSEIFRKMVSQLRQHIKNEFELKLLRQQAEYKALLMQINPHFLFNTLELISSLALQNRGRDTERIIHSLGQMMRYSLKISNDLVLLTDELKYVEHYFAIINLRYKDRAEIVVSKQGELDGVMMTKFIIQPLLENAVKYSFQTQEIARVHLHITRSEERLVIVIADNGPGIAQEQLDKVTAYVDIAESNQLLTGGTNQIGLGNVLVRCKLYYGELFQYEIDKSELGGVEIKLILPVKERE